MALSDYSALVAGLLFLLMGFLKVVPVPLNNEISQPAMQALLQRIIGVGTSSGVLLRLIGVAEAVIGAMLTAGRRRDWHRPGALYLLLTVIGSYVNNLQTGQQVVVQNAPPIALCIVLAMIAFRPRDRSGDKKQK